MERNLSRIQKVDVIMGLVTLVYFFFPWMRYGESRCNILSYLIRFIKADDFVEVYRQVFFAGIENDPYMLEITAKLFLGTCIVAVIMQILNLLYVFDAVRGRSFTRIPKVIALVVMLFIISTFRGIWFWGNIDEADWISAVPNAMFFGLVLIVILDGIWLLLSFAAKELDEVSGQVEEEKRKAEIRRQEILESYIGNLEQMVDEMRAFQHDYKNILSSMAGFIRENQIDELRDFFYTKIKLPTGDRNEQREAWKYLKNIHPMELKGFLYEKLLVILARNLRIQVHISENIDVKYSDMEDLIRIVGIYIDNAVEEAEKIENGEVAITIIETHKGILFCVENDFAIRPDIAKMVQKGYSTKGQERGFGLYWSEKILEKHADMVHELRITEDRVIQQIEVITEE